MAYNMKTGGGGNKTTTSWNSENAQNYDKFERIKKLGDIIDATKSPYFPKSAAEYRKHVAEYAVQKKDEERESMERKLEDLQAEKKIGAKVQEVFKGMSPAEDVRKLADTINGLGLGATTATGVPKKRGDPLVRANTASLCGVPANTKSRESLGSNANRDPFADPAFKNKWGATTESKTLIWAPGVEKFSNNAPWPERDERKYYGEERAKNGLKRYLPPPRALQVDGKEVAWLINSGVPEHIALKYLDMNPMEIPWELRKVMPEYHLSAATEEAMVKEYEEWKIRVAKKIEKEKREAEEKRVAEEHSRKYSIFEQGEEGENGEKDDIKIEEPVKEVVPENENGGIPPPGGWTFDEEKLREVGAWDVLLDDMKKSTR